MIVLTYNIHGGLGVDHTRSITRVADVIRASGAEIVCIQEAERRLPRSRFIDQPRWLGERLGMQFVYQRNCSFGPGSLGNVIVTRYPLLDMKSHSLTSFGEQRGLLEVTIDAPDSPVTVFCTHWGLSAEERVVQAAETSALVSAVPAPKLICADLNDIESSPPVTGFISAAGLHDLAVEAGYALPTFPADKPSARIDYILGSPEIAAGKSSVIESPASDHRPVLVEISLRE
ncbi:MAG: endonuclease/exonuclease/phosphatase family protein [Armatimonadetes bacterium]|nr:endonuclease/exonuclease/phosphatase family protein [Armatimonadota bacterium]